MLFTKYFFQFNFNYKYFYFQLLLQFHLSNMWSKTFDKRLHIWSPLMAVNWFTQPWPPSSTWFLGPTWVSPQEQSAIFAYTMQRLQILFSGVDNSPKLPPSPWGSVCHLMHSPFNPPESAPKWHLDWLSHFLGFSNMTTAHATPSVTMRPNNINFTFS